MENCYYWYQVTVQFTTEDHNTGKIKKTKENFLVKSLSIKNAEVQTIKDLESYTMEEYRIMKIIETNINRIIKPDDIELNAR